jgi:hypothetical protein
LRDLSFREALAQVLLSLDANTPIEVYQLVSKAQNKTIEIRETVHPKFITEMLTGILRGIGRPYDTVRIHKRTRDDVLWNNALKPWRRSPCWLLLRVALQTNLAVGEDNHTDYKSFMIFFMAQLLELALKKSLPSETLFVMAAKISRRTLKLALGDQQPGMLYIQKIVDDTHQELSKRWHAIEQSSFPPWKATRLSFHSDTELSAVNLKPYLDRVWSRAAVPPSTSKFTPVSPMRIDWKTGFPDLALLKTGISYPARLSLLDIDLWVQRSLQDWTTENLRSDTACTMLTKLIQEYTRAATRVYADSPEDTSLMLLTTMDLWVALDTCATCQHPLLKMYEPGFPLSLFDPLLLPKRSQMARLLRVEQHIQQRRDESHHPSSLIFQETNEADSFAVKYFEQSLYHQALRRDIETLAMFERKAKEAELARVTQEYYTLVQRSNSLSHDEGTHWDGYEDVPHHWPNDCAKCQLKQRADALEINVHEWPLPYIELEAKSAVFELVVPRAVAEWRDTTFTLLEDVFSPPKAGDPFSSKVYHLREYSGLNGHAQGKTGRLQLASVAKPQIVAHYRSQKVPAATKTNICVDNGLHYSIFDTTSVQWTSNLLGESNVRRLCTFQLPLGSHGSLQYAMDGTTHTSNEALARQVDCPRELNLHEFYAFFTLRSGHRLQWRNISRELTARILNFSHEETSMLIAQAAWQAGCSSPAASRESHIDLEEEDFGMSLMDALEDALLTVEGNWQGATALRTFIILATRLLSLSLHEKVHKRCYSFLKRARLVSLRWARQIGRLLRDEQDTEEMKTLGLRALEMALLCHGTFDVDLDHRHALLRSDEDVATVTECCIIIHDRCPAETHHLAGFLKILLQKFERSAHLMEAGLRSKVLQSRSGLDATLQQAEREMADGSDFCRRY